MGGIKNIPKTETAKASETMDHFNFSEDTLNINENLKYMAGNRFRWARDVLNLSRQKLVDHDHFKQIFGCYSIYKLKEIENGYFGKRNPQGELFKFLNGMSRFFNVSPKCFIDPVLSRKKFEKLIKSGTNRKYAIFNLPSEQHEKDKAIISSSIDEKKVKTDWGDAPDVSVFFGRQDELATLKKWIIKERCRLVAILGIRGMGKTKLSVKLCTGGIGKTDLSLKLAQEIGENFDYVIWRKLLNAPPLQDILCDLVRFISDSSETIMPETIDTQIAILHKYLKKYRCLILLDNLESILLNNGSSAGQFKKGYEEYEQFFRLIGEGIHQSCVLITSREKPFDFNRMEGKTRPVRSLNLGGLRQEESRNIFFEIGTFSGKDEHWDKLTDLYDGNPLAMELAARHIDEVFFGDISEFLNQGKPIFNDLKDLLNWHIQRLSDEEKEIMYWLTVEREAISIGELKNNILLPSFREQIGSFIQSLQRRMTIERSANGFTLQPVLMEYMTDRLIDEICIEVRSQKPRRLSCISLIKAQAKDYIRESQIRLILIPITQHLKFFFNSSAFDHQIQSMLSQMKKMPSTKSGYAPGNLLNILCTAKNEIHGFDFSDLPVWQAYLAGKRMLNINFSGSDFSGSVFTQSFGDLLTATFSPDGRLLAAGDAQGLIHIWDSNTGQKLFTCQGHLRKIWKIAFSPDGHIIASGSTDESVRIWSAYDGECLDILLGHTNLVNSVAFSPDGNLLASCGRDRTVRVWNICDGKCIAVLKDHRHWVWYTAFSPDGEILASCGQDHCILLRNINDLNSCRILKGHAGSVNTIAFSSDGKFIASGSADKLVKIWDKKNEKCLITLKGHHEAVSSVIFSPDGKILISSSRDRFIRIWDTGSGKCLNTLFAHSIISEKNADFQQSNIMIQKNDSVNNLQDNADIVRSLTFHPEGKQFVSCGTQQTLKLWDVKSGKVLNTLLGYTNQVKSVFFSQDGKSLGTCNSDHSIKIWNITDNICDQNLYNHPASIITAVFTRDSKKIISFCHDWKIRLWNILDGQCLDILDVNYTSNNSAELDSCGRKMVCFGQTSEIIVWDTRKGRILNKLKNHSQGVRSAVFSADGKQLFTCGFGHEINIWNLEKNICTHNMKGLENRVRAVFLSPDGKTLAGCGYDPTVLLWDIEAGKLIHTLKGHKAWVRSIAFSPDGRILATGGDDNSIRLWDIQKGKCLNIFEGHKHWIWSLAFSPDGRMLASGSEDGTARLWHIKKGKCLYILQYPRPYEGMNIAGVTGVTQAQIAALEELGAVIKY